MNVLARNVKTNELIAYVPLIGKTTKPLSKFKKIFISILVVILLVIAVYVTIKYFREKGFTGYEGIPNTNKVTELASINKNKGGYQRISL